MDGWFAFRSEEGFDFPKFHFFFFTSEQLPHPFTVVRVLVEHFGLFLIKVGV
jgi:hypothetical protein